MQPKAQEAVKTGPNFLEVLAQVKNEVAAEQDSEKVQFYINFLNADLEKQSKSKKKKS